MVKLQTTERGTHLISIPKKLAKAMKWKPDEDFALCPCGDGILRIVPIRGKGVN